VLRENVIRKPVAVDPWHILRFFPGINKGQPFDIAIIACFSCCQYQQGKAGIKIEESELPVTYTRRAHNPILPNVPWLTIVAEGLRIT